MTDSVEENQPEPHYPSLLHEQTTEALNLFDGWAEFLGAASETTRSELPRFVATLGSANGSQTDEILTQIPTEITELTTEEIQQRYLGFLLWQEGNRLNRSLLKAGQGVSSERAGQLIAAWENFQPTMPEENRATWTTILLLQALAQTKFSSSQETTITKMANELMGNDFFCLQKGRGGIKLVCTINKSKIGKDNWKVITRRANEWGIYVVDQSRTGDDIGRCYFTLTQESSGIEAEQKQASLRNSSEQAAKISQARLGTIRYDQYEPPSTSYIEITITEETGETGRQFTASGRVFEKKHEKVAK